MTRELHVVAIVEGQGDVAAVPILVRRIVAAIDPAAVVSVAPIRVGRDKVVKPGELERYMELAFRKAGSTGSVLVVLDADDDCPATLGPSLLDRAQRVRPDGRVSVVLANREFESWFLAAGTSLRSRRGLPPDLEAPGNAESIRDAKGWLQERRTDGFAYTPTADQPALAAEMDLDQARAASDSFDKLCREIAGLMEAPT